MTALDSLEPLEPDIDPALAALADAILIPPFPGTTPPPWLLRALGRGLAGVTLFGSNVDRRHRRADRDPARRRRAAEPVIAIDEEGGDVTRVTYTSGSPYPGNAALGAVDDVALTRSVYAAIGTDLARLGINIDLAPCADVLAPGRQPGGRHPVLRLRPRAGGAARRGRRGGPAVGRRGRLRQALPRARQHRRATRTWRWPPSPGTMAGPARPRPAAVRRGHRGRVARHDARAPAGARADRRAARRRCRPPPSPACSAANSASTAW